MKPAIAPTAVIVEDEKQIRRFVRQALEAENWHVFEAETLKQGLTEAGTRKPDLVIIDLGLPDGDGVDFIRDLRTWSSVPVIVLSARTDEDEKVKALDAGADDYLTKPFGVSELLARVRASLRRQNANARSSQNAANDVFEFGDVSVDLSGKQVRKCI
jgi:two-component system, OmpR family, KDP operon response regulator KdpE